MRIAILAIGRLKAGAEAELVERYVERAGAIGRQLGITLAIAALPESRAARAQDRLNEEATALIRQIPADATVIALDEGGEALNSNALADRIGSWREGGTRDLAFLIGGADGLGAPARSRAAFSLSFGRLTWPHQLVRAMLAEQIYRAATILTNHPYHRA